MPERSASTWGCRMARLASAVSRDLGNEPVDGENLLRAVLKTIGSKTLSGPLG
jgi:hypothetical protein